MAEGQVKQVLEKEITCPLCLDIFHEPKKLPCDHVYCKECVKRLAQLRVNATISCPECRFVTQPLNGDVNNFPTAFQINRLVHAFRQLQAPPQLVKQAEATKCPLGNTMCRRHTIQPLVFYCETCKESLCPDCVLVNKDHETHKYGFFKEIVPDYRKLLLNELASVKVAEQSVSDALKDVVKSESTVINHVGKCEEDIDAAFGGMFSVLHQCKQKMKDEARKHYSSLTGIFESKREQLQRVESELKEVTSSAVALLQTDDQQFIAEFESTMADVKNLQEEIPTVPLKVIEPQLLTAQAVSSDVLLRYFKTLCTLYNLANPKMCSVEGSVPEMHVNEKKSFVVTLNDSSEDSCKGGKNRIHTDLVNLKGGSTKGVVERVSASRVKIGFTPKQRGHHLLNVKVNGAHIANSPFKVFINMPPKLLTEPLTTVYDLKSPTGLIYSQGKLLATEKGRNKVVAIDTQHAKRELKHIVDVTEIAQDSKCNLYVSTATDHKVHKLNERGHTVNITGHFGKKNGEFNFPNGLGVSKREELYVCDSGNNRIQVFDLDLKFKRSFGKKGTGKGQFDFPSDVDFDSNGCIYVVDNGNCRIQVFTQSERHLQTIGSQKSSSSTTTKFDPVRIIVHNSHLYTTDYFNHHIAVFTMTGDLVTKFGGEFLHEPEGITVDDDGFVYVTSHHSKILVF